MKNWFSSLNGAVTLSVIALLTELWRAFMDFQYEYSSFLNSTDAVLLGTLLYTALFAGWAWALLRALHGSRSALIAATWFPAEQVTASRQKCTDSDRLRRRPRRALSLLTRSRLAILSMTVE